MHGSLALASMTLTLRICLKSSVGKNSTDRRVLGANTELTQHHLQKLFAAGAPFQALIEEVGDHFV